ncbi:soluble starch synthase 1, chloroplastic/amyloplastic [Malania oleifera]|uniref:soluble starch synthase 1, chloroplastic/amyloplastic n=1 Tax=Malania oleifera TaxID=397392 RepID=UPI0025AE8E03|nr:soluble starch synthase 1, chloroplastic/amyloplastic [Malania oleifera]
MESVQAARLVSCKPCLSLSDAGFRFSAFRQVGSVPLWRKSQGSRSLMLVRSVADKNGAGFRSSQNGSSSAVENEEEGLVLDTERDCSGAVVGFHLIPQTRNLGGGNGVIGSPENITINSIEGTEDTEDTEDAQDTEDIEDTEDTEDTEGEKKIQTRVTHNVVFVTAEAAPFSKTGGLGDVCGSLPIALAARGHRVMVVSPRYLNGTASDKKFAGASAVDCRIKIYCFGGAQEVTFFHEYRAGVDWVFVDHPSYHRPGNPYGDAFGAFGDNQFRFTLLCYAACEAPLVLPLGGYTYGEKCLFLVNDWHASLVPVLLAAKYRPYGVYKDARSILVIHNLSHQGVEPAATYPNLGLPPQWYGALEWVFPTWARTHALDTGEAVNVLKGAIVTADRIMTVSQGYSWEITTVEGGYGLDELLSSRKSVLNGITNGVDDAEWDPSLDEHIAFHYSTDDLSGKVKCKIALQKELGLPVRPDCPLIGFIGRLDYQKGIDLIKLATPELMEEDVQFVMLGSGEPQYEDWMRATESTYRDKFRGWVGFNVPISHRITAGCDILLMPSQFEPCGLNQLYAMRYGTVPVVHATGGLRDTVQNFNPYAGEGSGEGTGWAFAPLLKESMLAALRVAVRTYQEHKSSWEGIMKRGMQKDYTWDKAAVQYEQVFDWAFMDQPYVG